MSKRVILVATSLLVSGCFLFLGVMMLLEWDFTKLSTDQFETNRYELRDPFTNIRIVTDTAHVSVLPALERVTAVDCYELSKEKHAVSIKDGTLTIEVRDTRKWYEHIGVHFGTPQVRVYLPSGVYNDLVIEGETGDVEIAPDFRFTNMNVAIRTGNVTNRASVVKRMDIRTSTGDVCVQDLSAADISLSVTTGKISASAVNCTEQLSVHVSTGKAELNAVRCKNLVSTGGTGSLSLRDVVAAENLSVKRSTGDVHLDKCDAATIRMDTSTGDVSGSLLSEKVFIIYTDTGRVDVPKTITGGKCEITTDTGDISISIV